MRTAFLSRLVELAEQDERIHLLTGDLGFSVLEPFRDRFPDRYINVGVAEQNMIGVAAGLALTGKKVFTYSIVNFAVTRPLEQIRVDVCYHNLDVTVVAVGGGVPYGTQGYTHHGSEDVAFTRVLPNMAVMVPCDSHEAAWATTRLYQRQGPSYLRLGRGGEPTIHGAPQPDVSGPGWFEFGGTGRVAVLANGPILGECLKAAATLATHGIGVRVVSVPAVSPLPAEPLLSLARACDRLVVVEEHSRIGGLGSAVAEIVSEHPGLPPVKRLGLDSAKIKIIGDQRFLWQANGIDAAGITTAVLSWVAAAPT
ncbi:transketolase family protein [Nitrospirillum iridis]|uniref:Transketolase n=1 Tax=Nitrospirillum iridis TaxID=765888 RepID=A0A7X0EFN7_9PROT|nr:transketolase C-terminal domain-containing protein [Nitrospirillum iridis]MBB6255193.1 transketolase [Nitrospirillum iridis]